MSSRSHTRNLTVQSRAVPSQSVTRRRSRTRPYVSTLCPSIDFTRSLSRCTALRPLTARKRLEMKFASAPLSKRLLGTRAQPSWSRSERLSDSRALLSSPLSQRLRASEAQLPVHVLTSASRHTGPGDVGFGASKSIAPKSREAILSRLRLFPGLRCGHVGCLFPGL